MFDRDSFAAQGVAMPVIETEQSSDVFLRADSITLTYQDGRNLVYALREVSLDIGDGEFVGILGPPVLERPPSCTRYPESACPRPGRSI